MVTLTIKNKTQMRLDKLLSEAGKVGAIPNEFKMVPVEFFDFIKEMPTMTETTRASIVVVVGLPQKENEHFVLNRQLKSDTELSKEEINKLVIKWACKEYHLTYAGVPIVPGFE